ncbi:uncharacterized protein [Paramisgurnus dabryanus]|uniref:uncharacterized protein n=1 Tax=Paramisgurnus dabryanus TaxID=90735 RepID=UPI003CCFCE72
MDFLKNPIVFFRRPGRFSLDKFLTGLDNGSTLLFFKKNRPVLSIRRNLSAHEFTVPSVPEYQEEALGEPCGQRERETEDDEVQSSVSGAADPQTPAVQTAEEACPDEKAMIEDEDFEEEASESSSHHELSSVSGSGSDSSSLTKRSSSVVVDGSGDETLTIQPAACLPWIGQVVPMADLKPPAPRKGLPLWSDMWYTVDLNGSREESTSPESACTHQEDAQSSVRSELSPDGASAPQTPAVPTAEEACPDEKAMIEDEDFEEEASESSSHHELSSVSGSGSDSSSLSKGSSSVVADGSGDEPLAIQPAACLPWIGRVVSRADLTPPAPRKDGPPPAPAVVTAEEACPDEKAMIEDEDFEEEASESSSDHELSSVSGSGSDSSSLSKGSSSVVVDGSGDEPLAIQPAACLPWIGRVVSRADLTPPAPREGFPQWSDLWYTVDLNGSREKSTSPKSVCTHQEDTETKDLKARAEILVSELVRFSGCGSVSAEFRFKVGQMLVSFALTSEAACTLARETLDREMLRLRKEESSPQTLIHLYRFIKRFPMIFVGMKCQLHQWVLEDLEDPDLVSEDEDGSAEIAPADPPAEGPLLPAPMAVPEPPPGLLFFPAPAPAPQPSVEVLSSPPTAPAPQPSVEVLSFPAPLAVSEPPPGLLFFPAPSPAPQPSVEVLSSPPTAPAPAPQPSVEVLSFPAPLAVPEPPPGLLFFPAPAPAPQPSVEVLSSPPPAPAPQPSVEVLSFPAPLAVPEPPPGLLFFPAPAPAPQPSVEVLSSPPPAPAPQPSVEVLSFPAPLAVSEPPPGLLFFPAPSPAPQPSVEVLSSPPTAPAPAPQPSVEVLSFPAPLAVPEPPPGLLFFPAPAPAPQPSVEVLSSPPTATAPAPQPSVEVLSFPAPLAVPEPSPGLLFFPAPSPAPQPSVEVLSFPASLAVSEPPPSLLFFPAPSPAPQPSVGVLSSPPLAPALAPQPSDAPPQPQMPLFSQVDLQHRLFLI